MKHLYAGYVKFEHMGSHFYVIQKFSSRSLYQRNKTMNWYLFLAPLGVEHIMWIFSNLRVSAFKKSIMGCPNW